MSILKQLSKILSIVIHTITILSLLMFVGMMRTSLGQWPVFSYVMFMSWTLSLYIWAYQKLRREWLFDLNDLKEYRKVRTRILWSIFGLFNAWLFLFIGMPGNDEYGSYSANEVMAKIALKFFGYTFTLDNYTEFEFLSTQHMIGFYFLTVFPLLVLVAVALLLHNMSEKRYWTAMEQIKSDSTQTDEDPED